MNNLFEIITDYFTSQGWPFTVHESLPVVRMDYEGDNGSWLCYARVLEETNHLIFLSVLPETVPEDKRLPIAEFITRANFGLNIGNFEMDLSDGELRYKTSIEVTPERLTPDLIEPLVKCSWVVMDGYLPGIQSIIAGKTTPVEAIKKAHSDIQGDFDLIQS